MRTRNSLSSRQVIGGLWGIILSLVVPACTAHSAEVDVRQCGARGDGRTLDTAAIQKAIDQCGGAGGGIVRFSPGTYLSKPVSLWNNVTLQLDKGATLLATDEPADFTRANIRTNMVVPGDTSGMFNGLINGTNLSNIGISGKGIIDGAGASWWAPAAQARQSDKNHTLPRPRTIAFSDCRNVKISGVTLENSPSFHIAPVNCENVLIENVTIKAPDDSPNTDGINLNECRNVTVSECTIDVGGEDIVIKSSRPLPGRAFASGDITIGGCTFRHGSGVSIGSETMGGVHNVVVRDSTFSGTLNGLHFKSSRNKGGITENIRCENLTLKDVRDGIVITCYNQGLPANDIAQPAGEWTPIFRDIHLKNVTGNCSRALGLIAGLPESEIQNVYLDDVHISCKANGLVVRDAKDIQLKNVHLWPKQGDPIIKEENARIEDLDKSRTASN